MKLQPLLGLLHLDEKVAQDFNLGATNRSLSTAFVELNFKFTKLKLYYISRLKYHINNLGVVKRFHLHKTIYGKNNVVNIEDSVRYSNLRIVIKGSGNSISIGANCLFMGKTCIYIEGDGNSVIIGSNLIAQPNLLLVLAEGTQISIQDDCLFARDVKIRTSDQHGIYNSDNLRINPAKSIEIGKHVWIGADTIVNKGAIIGNDTVIGMRSIVTKVIPNNGVVAGVPARILKENTNWSREIK